MVGRIATGEIKDNQPPPDKEHQSPGGKARGAARAAKLTPEERRRSPGRRRPSVGGATASDLRRCVLRGLLIPRIATSGWRMLMVEDFETIPRLLQLGLRKELLLDVFDRALGERANVTESDPAGTGGLEMRRWCTRFLRDHPELRALGWVACAHEQIEGIRNDELRVKLVVVNTDACTGMPEKQPRNVSEKGAASEKLIGRNARDQDLFGDDAAEDPISNYDHWFFCVHASDKYASAEVSRPNGIVAGIVSSFSDRIIICRAGDKDGLRRAPIVPEDFAEVELPKVRIK